MPVLERPGPLHLPLKPVASTSFSQGELRGRMAGGVAHIQRFTLTGTDPASWPIAR